MHIHLLATYIGCSVHTSPCLDQLDDGFKVPAVAGSMEGGLTIL